MCVAVRVCSPSSERVASDILKQVLVQLVMYYKRFDDLIKRAFGRRPVPPPFIKDMVIVQSLMFEVKKYANARA